MAAATTAYIISLIRIGTGVAFLAVPKFTCASFLVPQAAAPAAILATRLAGARELAVGELLWYALRRHRAGGGTIASAASATSNAEQSPLLTGESTAVAGKGVSSSSSSSSARRESLVGYALVTGMAIDAIDVVSCLVSYAEGSLPVEPALLVGGIGFAAFGAGAFSYFKGPWKI